ncbi:MAG TPA: efflux RND transporter periplasmic adaptor subunit [Gemmatimonadaceae bacterium]|nr:efflux RND transporter periplasmic adaptor subunit [Gemmatimonadaceae bacterium]
MNDQDRDTTERRTILRWIAWALVPITAVLVAWFATRGSGDEAATASEHAGHGVAPASSTTQPVMLSEADARRIGVTYAVASVTPLEREIRTVGQVTFDETRVTSISPKIDGWIERLYVNFEGQPIAAGTPLFAIYSPMLVTAQEELLLAKRLVSEVAGGDAAARAGAESLLSSARRRLAYWDVPAADIARIEASGEVQRTMTLRSPVNGFVVEKRVLQGQRIMAGEALYRIANLATVWVEGEVFERDLAAVRLGQMVAVELDALPARGLRGRITYIYPTLNSETRTSRVRVELTNPGFQLKPGMYATLRWPGRGSVAALTVPRSAVVSTGERHLVFAKRGDGMLEPRQVEVGTSSTDRIEILRGLAAGDTVVASATFLLDAESNLGALLGGMGDMPGMDMTAPKKPEESSAHKNH